MEYLPIKAIASFNKRGEVQPLYFKLRHHDNDITLKVLYAKIIDQNDFYAMPGCTFRTRCEYAGREHELIVIYDAKSTIWKIDTAQLSGIYKIN